jgi:hypothetical protein
MPARCQQKGQQAHPEAVQGKSLHIAVIADRVAGIYGSVRLKLKMTTSY